jgi:hypothetical protein
MNSPSQSTSTNTATSKNTASSKSLVASNNPTSARAPGGPSQVVALVLSWLAVGLPLAWGVAETLRKALALFQ